MDSPIQATDILKISRSLLAENVNHVAFFSDNTLQILAIVLSNSDIVLWKVTAESANYVIKWIPWKSDENSKIQAIAFQPLSLESTLESKIELLVITYEGLIHLISVKEIINGETYRYNNSKVSLYPSCCINGFVPTAVVWWNSSHHQHKNIAIIGGNNGQIVFFSLTHNCYLASLNTESKSPIFSLSVCSDFFRDYSYLLVTNDLRQQWKLLLEKEVNEECVVLIAFDDNGISNKIERNTEVISKSQKSRLQEFKQMSVETFVLLKQKLNDSRRPAIDRSRTGSITHVEFSELQSCDCYGEAFLSVQEYRNRRVLTGLFIPEAVLLLYLQNKDSSTLIHHKFKISPLVTTLLLTHTFVYIADIMDTQHRILIFSTRLSECKKSEPSEYNPDSFVQSFLFPEDEQIMKLFKTEVKQPPDEKLENVFLSSNDDSGSSHGPVKIKQILLADEWNEACLVVTNKSVYVINLRNNPLKLTLETMKTDINVIKKFPLIFNLPLSKLIELVADQLVEDKNVSEAVSLYVNFKCFSSKMTLKLASLGLIETLLEHTEDLLSQTDLDLPLVERIHLSNFVVTSYAEQYLRNPDDKNLQKRFLKFLRENQYYDEEVNIYIFANYRLCSFVHFLSVWRGLYVDGVVALTNMIAQNQTDKYKTLHRFDGFWLLFSEMSFVDAFVLSPRTVHLHISFLREYLNDIPVHILKRLYRFYDPTQPVLKPAMCRILRTPVEEYLEAYDFENDKWGCDANMFDWITNFLYLHINLFKEQNLDCSLTKYTVQTLCNATSLSTESIKSNECINSISAPVLSAGFAHAALVRNGSLITWGQSAYGCLGSGPTLSQNCSPIVNTWFDDHRIRVKYVSCGRHHTLVLTENGVYSWGSSKFGQLGIGTVGLSLYPRLVESFSSNIIVSVAAGQYHSMVIDINGKVWTWGWGLYGQLGHGDTNDQYYPKCVQKLNKKFVTYVCGGQAHSIVLTKNGRIYTFGCNTYGQLGIGTNVKSTIPVKVSGIQENIIMIATNYFHNLALSDTNRLYTWGCSPQILKLHAQTQKRAKLIAVASEKMNNVDTSELPIFTVLENQSCEQLSVTTDIGKHLSPVLVDTSLIEGNIMQISCGLFHSALLSTESYIYTWGRNTDGQLGNCKRQTEISLPTQVNVFPVKLVSNNKQNVDVLNRPLWRVCCGKDYTLAIELESRFFGWGNNNCGQLGTLPQEDFSIQRFLNGKFIVNKYTKRMIKISHSGVNVIDKPIEILNLPKLQFLFMHDGNSPDRYLRLECDLNLPGFSQPHYPIKNTCEISSFNATDDQILHYYLECFHRYYNAEFILQICLANNNLQAASKVCCLNYRFDDAFFYNLKALLHYVIENYYFTSFKDSYGLSDNRLVAKNPLLVYVRENPYFTLCKEGYGLLDDPLVAMAKSPTKRNPERRRSEETIRSNMFNVVTNDILKNNVNFEFMADVIAKALSLFEYYYEMILKYTPDKIGSYLRKSLSVWIVQELPMQPLENFFLERLDNIAYPLAVLLFCENVKSTALVNNEESNNSSQIRNNLWKEKNLYLSTYLNKKKSLSSKTIKHPFLNSNNTKASYRNLYQNSNACLESNDPKYRLTSEEILRNLSAKFLLKLCNVVVDFVSSKPPNECEEFVRLLHEIIFAPSILKSDDRSAEEILSSILNTLQRSQSPPKKFIQISYEELRDKQIENKFIVFSCSHFFASQTDFEKEVKTVKRELDSLRLLNTSELVSSLFTESSSFETCCPRCLCQYIKDEVNSTTEDGEESET